MERAPMNVGMGGATRYPSASSQQQGISPSPTISVHFGSERRYTTVATPDSTVSPTAAKDNSVPTPSPIIPSPHFLHLLPTTRHRSTYSYYNTSTGSNSYLQTRGQSPSRRGVSPDRRIPDSQLDRGHDGSRTVMMNGTGAWAQQTGRRNDSRRNSTVASRNNGSGLTQGKKDGPQPARRPSNRRNSSNQSNLSTSMPSTPNHQPRNITSKSRSPSPHTTLLDSPKSAASEPIRGGLNLRSPCKYETLLSTVRRRFKYTDGEFLPKETPLKESLSESEDLKLTNDMNELFQQLVPSEESNHRRKKLVGKLEGLLYDRWPENQFQVAPFGSSENKLCTSESDIDVCIIVKFQEQINTCALSKALADSGMERVICVPGAKVPIVKIWDPKLAVACDMNINNTMAIENTRMMKTYVEIDPRVRPLAMILKYWTKQRVLNDALGATLGSYTWLCMILNYLQTRDPPILPSLHVRAHKQGPIIQGVDCSFDDDIEALRGFGEKNKESLGSLLFGFFKFYGYEVDYQNSVMSVRQGKVITKGEKRWDIGHNNIICVEEPFNVWRNLSNTCDSYSAIGLHREFRRGFKILAEKLDLGALCETYEFPKDEAPTYVPPPPPPKPTLTRTNSQHNRGRGGHSGNGGRVSRSFNSHNSKQGQYRKAPAAYTMQPQYLGVHDMYMLQPAHQQLYQPDVVNMNLQAQIQAQQILHAAQVQAHVQAQMHNQQNGIHNASQQPLTQEASPNLSTVAYYAQMLGIPFYYAPMPAGPDAALTPASPPSTPSASDSRSQHGREGQYGGYAPSPRSQPRPDTNSSTFGSSARAPSTAAGPSEDELDFGDLSSNGSQNYGSYHPPPETPPEEEIPDGYLGYYIGETSQADPAASPPIANKEEPFAQQKYIVDRQKRLSQEQLPPPLIRRSRPPSPHFADRDRYSQQTSPSSIPGPRRMKSRDAFRDDRSPLIVNGSSSTQSPVYLDEGYRPGGLETDPPAYPYDHVYDVSATAPHLVAHSLLNSHMNYTMPEDVSTQMAPLHRVLHSSPQSAVESTYPEYGHIEEEANHSAVNTREYAASQQQVSSTSSSTPEATKQILQNGAYSDTSTSVPTPEAEIKPSQPPKSSSSTTSEAHDQSAKSTKPIIVGDVKSKSPPTQPIASKKQGKNNNPAPNGQQPKRKATKSQGIQVPANPIPAPVVPVAPADPAPIPQARAIAKEPIKNKGWKQQAKKRHAKKQANPQGSERKEVLVDGERKGG